MYARKYLIFITLCLSILIMGHSSKDKDDSRSKSRFIAQAREADRKRKISAVDRRMKILDQQRKRTKRFREIKTRIAAAVR